MAQRTVNDTDTGVGPVTRTRTAKAKVSGPRPSDLPAAERSNRDDDLQGAMMVLLRQQQRTMGSAHKGADHPRSSRAEPHLGTKPAASSHHEGSEDGTPAPGGTV